MSRENVEIVRATMQAFLGANPESALEFIDPAVIFDARTRPDGKTWSGQDGVRQAIAEWIGVWDEYQMQVESYVDLGDRVLTLWHERGRGRGSGVPMEQDGATIVTLRDGRITHFQPYSDQTEAVTAVGLSE